MAETSIVITAETGQAEGTMRTLGDSIDGVSKRMISLSSVAGTLGGALSLTAFATFVAQNVKSIDALNDLSDATGASIENLSALEDRAVRTGTSMDTVGTTLIKFNNVLNEAKPGSAAEQALKSIGLNAAELRKLDPAEALRQTAVALSRYADDGEKARRVQEIFSKGVREIGPLLKDLAEGGNLVAKVSTQQALEVEKFNKELATLKKNSVDAGRALVSDLVMGINAAAKAWRESGLVAGLQTLLTGDDSLKNNKRLVELTNELLRAENALSASRARDAQFGDKSLVTVAAEKRLVAIKAELQTVQGYRQMLEQQAPAAATDGKDQRPTVGGTVDPEALRRATEEARKLREEDIQGWVKYADAVLAEGDRVDDIVRKQIETQNAAEQKKIGALVDAFNTRNQTLAEMVAQQDLAEEERIEVAPEKRTP